MTRFEDGPAKGQTLMLKRAAYFIRVTSINLGGGRMVFDALDQLDDRPLPDEVLYAYEITERPLMCHVYAGKRSGFYPSGRYKFVAVQPSDAEMRNENSWDEWCRKQPVKNL